MTPLALSFVLLSLSVAVLSLCVIHLGLRVVRLERRNHPNYQTRRGLPLRRLPPNG